LRPEVCHSDSSGSVKWGSTDAGCDFISYLFEYNFHPELFSTRQLSCPGEDFRAAIEGVTVILIIVFVYQYVVGGFQYSIRSLTTNGINFLKLA